MMRRRRRVRTICEGQHRTLRRWALSMAAFLLLGSQAHADTITQIAQELTTDSMQPLSPSVANGLATNLWDAQLAAPYAATEPDSLALSITAVLRAITLDSSFALALVQSEIAIDDRAGVEFTVNGIPIAPGTVIDFGDVPIGQSAGVGTVEIPEPSTMALALGGLDILLIGYWLRRRRIPQ